MIWYRVIFCLSWTQTPRCFIHVCLACSWGRSVSGDMSVAQYTCIWQCRITMSSGWMLLWVCPQAWPLLTWWKVKLSLKTWTSKHRRAALNLAVTFWASVASCPQDTHVTCHGWCECWSCWWTERTFLALWLVMGFPPDFSVSTSGYHVSSLSEWSNGISIILEAPRQGLVPINPHNYPAIVHPVKNLCFARRSYLSVHWFLRTSGTSLEYLAISCLSCQAN